MKTKRARKARPEANFLRDESSYCVVPVVKICSAWAPMTR